MFHYPDPITPPFTDVKPAIPVIPGAWLLTGGILSVMAVGLLMASARLTIDPLGPAAALLYAGGAASAGLCSYFRRPVGRSQHVIRDAAEYIGLFSLTSLLGVLASYAAAADSAGYFDGAFERLDRLLGFDWLTWYAVVVRHGSLQIMGSAVYGSIFLSPLLILVCCAVQGNVALARRFIATFWLSAIITLVLFAFFPARGPLACMWHGPIPYMPTSGLYQPELIDALRARATTSIRLGDLHGLVCSPSFHTVSAVSFMLAAWEIRHLRWPLLLLNLAMLLATPVEGTHYLVDMVAGVMVACVAHAIMAQLLAAFGRMQAGSGAAADFAADVHGLEPFRR